MALQEPGGLFAVGLSSGKIDLHNTPRPRERVRKLRGPLLSIRALVFTSDGSLVGGSEDGVVRKWDAGTGREVWSLVVPRGLDAVSELADGRLVVGGDDGSVRVLDGVAGHEIVVCRGHAGPVQTVVALGARGLGSFASGSKDGSVRVWAGDGTLVRVVGIGAKVWSLALSPCGQFAAAGCGDGSVKLYRLPDWHRVWSVKTHGSFARSLSWSPDRCFLASGSGHGKVKILSANTGATVRILRGHTGSVTSIFFSPDGTKVFTGSIDKTVRVWRIFWQMERRVRALCEGLVVDKGTDVERDGLREVARRMKRLWEFE
jgi:WD40 repeat protein